MSAKSLAAITMSAHGGGVAAASRLMWRVFQDRWSGQSRLVTLVDDARASRSLASSLRTRLGFGARLAKAQMLTDCDWVFYTHLSVAQVQSFLPAGLRRPYGVFLHGIEVWGSLNSAQRRVLENARLLISNSKYTADRVRAAHPWAPIIHPCPLALVPETGVVGKVRLDANEFGAHAVIVVGRMSAAERYKGHDQLLEAWPAVRESVPDARLIFVGTGDDEGRLKARASGLGLNDSVVFTGFVEPEDLRALYRSAALLAMPSRNEGFGLVYLEAMSRALPCIGSREDAAGEIIEEGKTGFLVDQPDIEELADRLRLLLTNSALRLEMGERGRRRAQDRFSYASFRDRFATLLSEGFETGPRHHTPVAATELT